MLINIQDDIQKLQALGLLDKLLIDKTTKKNIMWATDAHSPFGTQFQRNENFTADLLTGTRSGVIQNRAHKAMEQQSERTRQHAEVFTPLWVCKKMCDYVDEIWDKTSGWQKYVDSRILEITCGEAPFLVSRYDVETGESVPVDNRIGLLDRKLRAVSKNVQGDQEWLKWAARAFQSAYGYEFQGDNLLIARVNLLMTFGEYLWERWHREPTKTEYAQIANIIAWNIWQMDGLTGTLPYSTLEEEKEIDWFGMFETDNSLGNGTQQPGCRIYNWRTKENIEYLSTKGKGEGSMKFDFVIGNPPYQEEIEGSSDRPIYNDFMDGAYSVSDKVVLITPARFLFNAGKTPKAWNQKMLADEHLKVLLYQQDSSRIFPNTNINGGIAITYRDAQKVFGAIEVFAAFDELRSIQEKMRPFLRDGSITDIMILQNRFNLEVLYQDFPECADIISSEGKERRIVSSAFEKLPVFMDKQTKKSDIRILGLLGAKRQYRWIQAKYIESNSNLHKWKVFVPASNGASGTLGQQAARIISKPVIGTPEEGITQTFISVGAFETESEAQAVLKYVKSKFARALLGILKITQHNSPEKWKYVPLQDFTSASDIDWSKSIPEIDQRLYAKYGLDEKEIEFIETHVKEME